MNYTFKDMYNLDMFKTTRVMVITGKYHIFNNIINDTLRDMCKGDMNTDDNLKLFDEFGVSDESGVVSNTVEFKEFMRYVKSPALVGKWFCSVDFKSLSDKEKEQLEKYSTNPYEHGVLVVRIHDYKDYRAYLKSNTFKGAAANLIQLSFPDRVTLKILVNNLFAERGVKVEDKALQLFIMRMSNKYDEYTEVIDNICVGKQGITLSYSDMLTELKNVNNYMIDEFVNRLTTGVKSDKVATGRKIYNMEEALIKDMGVKGLIKAIKNRVSYMVEMRAAINSGIIPINVRYSVEESQSRLKEDSKLRKLSTYSFRKMADIAKNTSLKDWVFMYAILNSVSDMSSNLQCERVLHFIVHRNVLSTKRMLNIMGVSDVLGEQLVGLNSIVYNRE